MYFCWKYYNVFCDIDQKGETLVYVFEICKLTFFYSHFSQYKDVICQTEADVDVEDGDGIGPDVKDKSKGELDDNVSAIQTL